MVHPKRCRLLCQATLDTILKCPDCVFYLPVGFAVANGNAVMDDAQPFTELCEAAHKLVVIVCPDVVWLAPTGNQAIIQQLGGPPAM